MAGNTTKKQGVNGLSLTKRTLKNLSVRREDPKGGGFIMKDSIIIPRR
jgi:hypothetical protein